MGLLFGAQCEWFWIVPGVVLVIGGIGNALGGETPQSTPAATEATTGGLEQTEAMTACDFYGQGQFPYGYDAHWIMGLMNDELDTANDEWDFKLTADVTNAFNAEREVTVECSVTGSNETPAISHFDAY